MSDEFKPTSIFKITIIIIALLLFSGMAFVGYQFIGEAQRSASGIQSHSELNQSNDLDFSTFSNSIPLPSNRKLPMASSETASTGDDVQIKAGEFAYRNGQPIVRMILHNNSSLNITAVSVSLSLMLDDDAEAAASAVGIPIALSQPLLPDADVRVDLPVSGEAWQAETVRMANKRRIWVQIISVNGDDEEHLDYPQTGQGVFLKQMGNDWSAPMASDTPLPDNDFASTVISRTPPPDFVDPTAGMNLDIPEPVRATELEYRVRPQSAPKSLENKEWNRDTTLPEDGIAPNDLNQADDVNANALDRGDQPN